MKHEVPNVTGVINFHFFIVSHKLCLCGIQFTDTNFILMFNSVDYIYSNLVYKLQAKEKYSKNM